MMTVLEDAYRETSKLSTESMKFPTGRKNLTDNYITTDLKNESCNRGSIKDRETKRRDLGAPDAPGRPTCGLEHVSLAMILAAAPPDWLTELEHRGDPGWSALTAVAFERMPALGINQTAWAMAQAALGRNGAAVLVLIADARHAARGGTIRNPGAWVRRMAERAERGEAHLHRSVFGILHEARTMQ